MKKSFKILILGKGTIGRAVAFYLKKLKTVKKVAFFDGRKKAKEFDFLIGALPSEAGKRGLELALKYKKDLIDISALPISFYLKHKKEIIKKGIRVISGCGVSPGLVNLIVGHEVADGNRVKKIEIAAGTLPGKNESFFPFTWCFEDLIEQHLYKASVVENGKKKNLPPFSGYRKEGLPEVGEFESYFIEEWSSLFYTLKPKNISFRVIRPLGFKCFFEYLKNHGFFEKENIALAKELLCKKKEGNTTLLFVKIAKKNKTAVWKIFSFAGAKEKLNSMQKITAIVPLVVAKLLFQDRVGQKGIVFMEDLAKDKKLFKSILKEIKNEKSILVKSQNRS